MSRVRRSAATVAVLAVASAAGLPGGSATAAGQRAGSAAGSVARAPAGGVISTIAGGIGGPGKGTKVSIGACGVSYAAGRVYTAGGSAVRQVSPATDGLTTVAGTGAVQPLGDGGPAVTASLDSPCGIAVGHAGNLLIADSHGERVRIVARTTGRFYGQPMTAGNIYTIAGTGVTGYSGDGGPATKAQLDLVLSDPDLSPAGVAVDGAGNLVIADTGNNRIRVVASTTGTFYGRPMTTGDIYTVAGDGTAGSSGDGGPATSAELSTPGGVAVDTAGNLVIADSSNDRIGVVAGETGTFYGQAMTAGDIYTVAGNGTRGFSGDGGPATSAELSQPVAVTIDHAGSLVLVDGGNSRVRVVAGKTGTLYRQAMTAGDIYTVAGNGITGFSGDGGPATSAEFFGPNGVAVDGTGNLLIADTGRIRVVAVRTGTFYRQPMTAGDIYAVAGNNHFVLSGEAGGFSGDGGPATKAVFFGTWDVSVDHSGNLAIIDTDNLRIRVVAKKTGTFYGHPMTAGDVYTIAGNGGQGFSGDGGPATKAKFNFPDVVAPDNAGNLLIADTGNGRIRVVAGQTGTFYGQTMTAGNVYTIAGTGLRGSTANNVPATKALLGDTDGVAVDGAGNLVITDTGFSEIRVVAGQTGTFYGQTMTAGNIYTVAGNGTTGFSGDGGPATAAELDGPGDTVLDGTGNLVITDVGNDRIRVVAEKTGTFYGQTMTAGDIYTVAGNGTTGFSGDGGPAAKAEFSDPTGVAVDSTGNLAIADQGNNRIRMIAEKTGTFYGQAMTANHIYTVAGTCTTGFSGDGGPAIQADLSFPVGLTVNGPGLLIADAINNRIRQITR